MILFYNFRDDSGIETSYEPIAVIEHQGEMTRDGEGQGHYICDLIHKESQEWYRTNDNRNPVKISMNNVTKNAVVVLYKKK